MPDVSDQDLVKVKLLKRCRYNGQEFRPGQNMIMKYYEAVKHVEAGVGELVDLPAPTNETEEIVDLDAIQEQ